jgi:hypothetical protein
LIKLAASLPVGSSERRAILAGLEGGRDFSSELAKLKKLMPAGTELRYAGTPGVSLVWNKKGGHAGEGQIRKTIEKFKAIGFRSMANSYDSSSPDGSVISNGSTLEKDGLIASFFTSYGATPHSNYFSIRCGLTQRLDEG